MKTKNFGGAQDARHTRRAVSVKRTLRRSLSLVLSFCSRKKEHNKNKKFFKNLQTINYDKNFNCRSQTLSKMVIAAETALLQILPHLFSLRP